MSGWELILNALAIGTSIVILALACGLAAVILKPAFKSNDTKEKSE